MLLFFAGVGTTVVIWWLFNLAVAEPADRVPERIAVRGEPLSVMATLAHHIGTSVISGSKVELLENGDEIFPPMLEAIREAQDTVNFLTYVYWTGDIADEFSEELSAAARRGVAVRVLLDGYGAHRIEDRLVAQMEAAGCEVAWFHPFSWYHLRHYNNRTHRKVLVVDGQVGFTGGVGIAEEWTGDAEDESHWRDDHFRVLGPAVAALQTAFAENWNSATDEVITGSRFFPELLPAGEAEIVPVITSPRGDRSVIAFSYWLLMNAAEHKVDIVTPYFVPDAALVDAVAETARRGVRVRLLVPNDHNDSRMVRWASRALYSELIDAGVEVYEYQPTMLHVKLLLVDDELALIGSANFDNRSFELNDEVSLVVRDRGLIENLRRSTDEDLTRAERIEQASFVSPRWWKRVLGTLGLTLREQL